MHELPKPLPRPPAFDYEESPHHEVAHSLVDELVKRGIEVKEVTKSGFGDNSVFVSIPVPNRSNIPLFHNRVREALVAAWGHSLAGPVEGRVVYTPDRLLNRDAPVHRVTQNSIEEPLPLEELNRVTLVGVELRTLPVTSERGQSGFTYRTPEEWERLKPFRPR